MRASSHQARFHPLAQAVFWIVAAFYAYGALVHILNIASLTGFAWSKAPLNWQVLDVVYLVLDVVVVVGLVRGWWIGVCYADGEDIGAAVIAAGHALDCRRYSGGRYRHLETPAAKSRIRRAGYC